MTNTLFKKNKELIENEKKNYEEMRRNEENKPEPIRR